MNDYLELTYEEAVDHYCNMGTDKFFLVYYCSEGLAQIFPRRKALDVLGYEAKGGKCIVFRT